MLYYNVFVFIVHLVFSRIVYALISEFKRPQHHIIVKQELCHTIKTESIGYLSQSSLL